MNARLLFLPLALCLSVPTLTACLNPFKPFEIKGTVSLAEDGRHWNYRRGITAAERRRIRSDSAEIRALWRSEPESRTFESRMDYAVRLILLGHPRGAIEILRQLERERPGTYSTAANLGTAFELTGSLDSARYWIAEDMRRNARGHGGSEWIHLRILEAKRALQRERGWLGSHSVLGIDFGPEGRPTLPRGMTFDSLRTIQSALRLQLEERGPFAGKRDPIVADLLRDYSTIHAILVGIDPAHTSIDSAAALAHARSGGLNGAGKEKTMADVPSVPAASSRRSPPASPEHQRAAAGPVDSSGGESWLIGSGILLALIAIVKGTGYLGRRFA